MKTCSSRPSTSCNAVPPYQRLQMPSQDLRHRPRPPRVGETLTTHVARVIAFGGALLLTCYAGYEMWGIINGLMATALQWIWLALFVVSFAWIAFAASSALAGLLPYRRRSLANADTDTTSDDSRQLRTALLMPVYNEDPANTTAALEAMAIELLRIGRAREFEIFIISDTRDPAIWVKETAAYQRLRDRVGERIPVWYRRRHNNAGRKAGNVRGFVEDWGGRYDFMIVLDADSLMSASTMATMVDRMSADPELGLLQTVPRLQGGHSLFARLQQFAGFLYGPVVARGVAAWQGDSGNFWGHNAIIRIAPFAAACGLPQLRGKAPFGGSILSHDFVEAALLRRAGWRVSMAPDLDGSWEATPPTLLDVAARDRRWAQGNLQHSKVIATRRLAWTNRAHFLIGIMGYVASPLWLALITLGLVIATQALLVRPDYFSQPFQLFPTWPQFDAERMIGLFVFSMAVLLTPKALGLVDALSDRRRRQAAGGGLRLISGSVVELVVSALYAPILMMIQSRQIYEILRGRDAGWNPQRRDADGGIDWQQIWARHWVHLTIGVAVAIPLGYFSPILLAWLSPTLLGLMLAPWLSAYSGSTALGLWLARRRLLLTADETSPALHRTFAELQRDYGAAIGHLTPEHLATDAHARRRHFEAVLPLPQRTRGKPDMIRLSAAAKVDDARVIAEVFHWLEQEELLTLLADRQLFERIPDNDPATPVAINI